MDPFQPELEYLELSLCWHVGQSKGGLAYHVGRGGGPQLKRTLAVAVQTARVLASLLGSDSPLVGLHMWS